MNKLSKGKIIIICIITTLILCYWVFFPCPFLSSKYRDGKLPAYIIEVWPPAGSKIGLGCYSVTSIWHRPAQRGVGVAISVSNILHFGTSYEYEYEEPFEERVSLYIDGKLVPNANSKRLVLQSGEMLDNNFTPSKLAATYEISWAPRLYWGEHIAKVVVVAPFEKILEYEWHFIIQ